MSADAGQACPVAFWLVPEASLRAPLQARIDALAARHDAPRFTPHMTLHAGLQETPAKAIAAARAVASGHGPVRLRIGPASESPARFRTLVLRLLGDGADAAATALRALLPRPGAFRADPHLSLLYAQPAAGTRARLAREHDGLRGMPIVFDTIAVVAPPAGDSDFADVAGWRWLASFSLEGPA